MEYLFLTEKYLVDPEREKYVNDFYFGKETQKLENNKHKNSKQWSGETMPYPYNKEYNTLVVLQILCLPPAVFLASFINFF